MARFAFKRQSKELTRIGLSKPAIKRVRFVFPCRARTKARFALPDPSPDEGAVARAVGAVSIDRILRKQNAAQGTWA